MAGGELLGEEGLKGGACANELRRRGGVAQRRNKLGQGVQTVVAKLLLQRLSARHSAVTALRRARKELWKREEPERAQA